MVPDRSLNYSKYCCRSFNLFVYVILHINYVNVVALLVEVFGVSLVLSILSFQCCSLLFVPDHTLFLLLLRNASQQLSKTIVNGAMSHNN